jgi:hypothetical protein
LPHKAFALQIRQNRGLQTIALLRSRKTFASANFCYAPPCAQSQHVLPDFVRSEQYLSEPEFPELLVTFASRHTAQPS